MVNGTSSLDNDSVVLVVHLVLRLESLKMSCMSTLLFDSRLIGLEVPNLVQLVIRSGSQPYESN